MSYFSKRPTPPPYPGKARTLDLPTNEPPPPPPMPILTSRDREPTPVEEYVAGLIWKRLEADPEFVAAMERGKADIEAGRVTPFRDIARAKYDRDDEDDE